MLTAKDSLKMARLPCGRILAAGGVSEAGVISRVEVYDAVQDAWHAVGHMIEARCSFEIMVVSDGTVLAAGGYNNEGLPLSSAERYNPISCSWSSAGSMTDRRESCKPANKWATLFSLQQALAPTSSHPWLQPVCWHASAQRSLDCHAGDCRQSSNLQECYLVCSPQNGA